VEAARGKDAKEIETAPQLVVSKMFWKGRSDLPIWIYDAADRVACVDLSTNAHDMLLTVL
jgi:hypothetical protein